MGALTQQVQGVPREALMVIFDFGAPKNTIRSKGKTTFPLYSKPQPKPTPSTARRPLPPSHPRLSPRSACSLAYSLIHSVLCWYLSLPLASLMANDTLYNLLNSASWGSPAEKAAALLAAIAYLQSLPSYDTGSQLTYRGGNGRRVLHLLAGWFSACEQAASLLSLVMERGRQSCGTTALMSHTTASGRTPLHYFAFNCSDLSLTKMVLREHPPSLAVLDNYGYTPLYYASTSERADFFRAATAAFNTSNLVAFQTLCDSSSPYLAREISRQAIALRAAVAICLNRQEEAPSAPSSVKAGIALSLLERVRDFGRAGNSSDLLRLVLEFVGPYAD